MPDESDHRYSFSYPKGLPWIKYDEFGRVIKETKMKYLAFDLEIVKKIPDGIEDWKSLIPLGISCASTLTSGERDLRLWYHGMGNEFESPESGAMTPEELDPLIDYMLEMLDKGYHPLTWNGLSFDFYVLAIESDRWEECIHLAKQSVDMMFEFFCTKGYWLELETAAKGQCISGKTEGMNGALAPIMWAGDVQKLQAMLSPWADLSPLRMREKVLEYVGQDSITTMDLSEAILKKGRLDWISKKGRPNSFYLNNKESWLTVEECLALPEPDTSWMDEPKSRSEFVNWFLTKENNSV